LRNYFWLCHLSCFAWQFTSLVWLVTFQRYMVWAPCLLFSCYIYPISLFHAISWAHKSLKYSCCYNESSGKISYWQNRNNYFSSSTGDISLWYWITVHGGMVSRFKVLSKTTYILNVLIAMESVLLVFVPENKVSDIVGNLKSTSNELVWEVNLHLQYLLHYIHGTSRYFLFQIDYLPVYLFSIMKPLGALGGLFFMQSFLGKCLKS